MGVIKGQSFWWNVNKGGCWWMVGVGGMRLSPSGVGTRLRIVLGLDC